jgi:glutaredoxin-like protein NrdH
MITVYSKPACPACQAVKHWLDKAELDYTTIDVTQDAEALAYVTSLGYQGAPVIVTDSEHWAGVHPDRIKALAAR